MMLPVKSVSTPFFRGLHKIALGCICTSIILPGHSARADGEFVQLDISGSTFNTVISVVHEPLTLGATAVTYEGGSAYGLNATCKLPFAQEVATLKMGPSAGFVQNDNADDSVELGLKFTAERYTTTRLGGIFTLADLNSIDRSLFVLSQLNLTQPGIFIELSYGESDNYAETSIAAAKQLSDSPISFRLGYKLDAGEIFAGVLINTF
jgi:hypothetical protein